MTRTFKVLIAVAALLSIGGSPANGQSWDAASDFSTTSNPAGAWTYGWSSSVGGPMDVFAFFTEADVLSVWYRGGLGFESLPAIAHNGTDEPVLWGGAPGSAVAPGVMIMHPGPDETNAVLRWTCPYHGLFDIIATFTGNSSACGPTSSTADVHILVNGGEEYSADVSGYGTSASTEIYRSFSEGDIVEFVVGNGPDDSIFCDHIAADIVIYSTPATCGAQWLPTGGQPFNGNVYALTTYDGDLVAGGYFTSAGGVTVNNIARWDGAAWNPLATGLNGGVTALAVHGGDLIAGGAFTQAGGVAASHIARWDGLQWHALGSGTDNAVRAITEFQGDLIVGGIFESPGSGVARWDGTSWTPIGGGLPVSTAMGHGVNALASYGNDLIAGGLFWWNGPGSSSSIARWDGFDWLLLGGGVGTPPPPCPGCPGIFPEVNAIVVDDASLIVAGTFTSAGGVPTESVARWDGHSWTEMNLKNSIGASTACVYNGTIIVGGEFGPEHIVRRIYDKWYPIGGTNDTVFAVAPYHGELIVAGEFSLADGSLAPKWGRFTSYAVPWLFEQPQSLQTAVSTDAQFQVVPAAGYEDVTYQWRHDGMPVNNGLTQGGSIISGATTSTLSISNTAATDTGGYDCLLSTYCGSEASDKAFLSLTSCMRSEALQLLGMGGVGPGQFGNSVALSADGNTALIGAPLDDAYEGILAPGAAYAFVRSGDEWIQQGPKFVPTDTVGVIQHFGRAVALSADGNTAIVGAPLDDYCCCNCVPNSQGIGAAYVFVRSDSKWTQQGPKLVPGDVVGWSWFGQSVSLSDDGNTACVGAPSDNYLKGAAYMFVRSNGAWTQQGSKIVPLGGVGEHQGFGEVVSLDSDGNTVLVGAYQDSHSAGAAYVFTRVAEEWTQVGRKIVPVDGVGEIQGFGNAVSLSGDGNTALIGAWQDDNSIGAAYIFAPVGDTWTQVGPKLVPNDEIRTSSFGSAVSLHTGGSIALIGAEGDGVGAAYTFAVANNEWTQQGRKLVPEGLADMDYFGDSVSLAANGAAIVGAPLANRGIGAAYYFASGTLTALCVDLNGDKTVDGADLGILLGAWGTSAADLTGDGT